MILWVNWVVGWSEAGSVDASYDRFLQMQTCIYSAASWGLNAHSARHHSCYANRPATQLLPYYSTPFQLCSSDATLLMQSGSFRGITKQRRLRNVRSVRNVDRISRSVAFPQSGIDLTALINHIVLESPAAMAAEFRNYGVAVAQEIDVEIDVCAGLSSLAEMPKEKGTWEYLARDVYLGHFGRYDSHDLRDRSHFQ